MEHLNGVMKDHIASLGANVTEQSIFSVGVVLIKGLLETCSNFDKQLQLAPSSTRHSKANTSNDEKVIINCKELTETSRVFDYVPGRKFVTTAALPIPIYCQ